MVISEAYVYHSGSFSDPIAGTGAQDLYGNGIKGTRNEQEKSQKRTDRLYLPEG